MPLLKKIALIPLRLLKAWAIGMKTWKGDRVHQSVRLLCTAAYALLAVGLAVAVPRLHDAGWAAHVGAGAAFLFAIGLINYAFLHQSEDPFNP